MDVLYSKGHSHKRLGQSVGRLMGSKGGGLIHAPKRGAPVSVHDIVRGRSRPLAERHGPTASCISVPAAFFGVALCILEKGRQIWEVHIWRRAGSPISQTSGCIGRRRLEASSPISHISRPGRTAHLGPVTFPSPRPPIVRTYKPFLVVTDPFSDLLPTSLLVTLLPALSAMDRGRSRDVSPIIYVRTPQQQSSLLRPQSYQSSPPR